MGRIVVTEFVSLDGVVEAPGGGEDGKHAGWTFEIDRGAEGDAFKLDELVEAEAQLLGRVHPMRLVNSHTVGDGIAILIYEPTGNDRGHAA
jgi:hypothetical protein